jgi:hypothetical protein
MCILCMSAVQHWTTEVWICCLFVFLTLCMYLPYLIMTSVIIIACQTPTHWTYRETSQYKIVPRRYCVQKVPFLYHERVLYACVDVFILLQIIFQLFYTFALFILYIILCLSIPNPLFRHHIVFVFSKFLPYTTELQST